MENNHSRGNGKTSLRAGKRGSTSHALTARQKLFALEYLKDLNGTKAAERAGYSKKTARFIAAENLTKPHIAAEIQKAMDARAKRIEVSGDKVLQGIAVGSFYDVRKFFDEKGNSKEIYELDDQTAQAVAGFEVVTLYEGSGDQKHAFGQLRKVRLVNRTANLELLGRHLKLFTDKVEHGATDELTELLASKLDFRKLSDSQLEEVAQALAAIGTESGVGRPVPAGPTPVAAGAHQNKG